MSFISDYIRYVSYFFRYHPILALCLLYDEVKGERRYQLKTTGFEKVDPLKVSSAYDSYSYMPSNYVLLEKALKEVNRYQHNHTFLDLGSGKGRAIMVAAWFNFQRIIGVEVNKDYCDYTQKQIIKKQHLMPKALFEVICTDASIFNIPDNIQTIFLYNPFKEVVVDAVIGNIMKSLTSFKRSLYLIYLNPLYRQNFINAGFTEIYKTTRFGKLKASVFYLENPDIKAVKR